MAAFPGGSLTKECSTEGGGDRGRPERSGRVLAVDYGRRRFGLAVSDPLGITTHPLPALEVRSRADVVRRLEEICEERDVGLVVFGLPRNMDGTLGSMGREVLAFVETFRDATARLVETWDERLTSREAERSLRSRGLSLRKRKARVDAVAAQLLLQAYLDAGSRGSSREGEPSGT